MTKPSPLSRRSFLIRSAATAGAITGAAALLDACGVGGSGTTTLNIMYSKTETAPQYFAEFEKANNCKIVLTEYDATKLSALLAAGTPPISSA